VASLSPTPGNIGAIEIALSAGLTAIGVPAAAAVGAVLIYRLLTFWLPLAPGFVAFRYLQKNQHVQVVRPRVFVARSGPADVRVPNPSPVSRSAVWGTCGGAVGGIPDPPTPP
jgi:hypothetical protein